MSTDKSIPSATEAVQGERLAEPEEIHPLSYGELWDLVMLRAISEEVAEKVCEEEGLNPTASLSIYGHVRNGLHKYRAHIVAALRAPSESPGVHNKTYWLVELARPKQAMGNGRPKWLFIHPEIGDNRWWEQKKEIRLVK